MLKNKRLEKMRMKLACIFVVKILMIFVLVGVFGLTLWLCNELLELNIIYIVISSCITMPIFIVLYNVIRMGYDTTFSEYMALYNHFITKEAVKYNTETVIEFEKNSFDDTKAFNNIGFIGEGTNYFASSWFTGKYNEKNFEGAYIHSMTRDIPGYGFRRLLPTWLLFILRIDYIKNYIGLVGKFEKIKFGKDPIVIYDVSYPTKKWIYEFDDNCIVKTGNEEFDKQFIVKSARVDGAITYLNEDIMNSLMHLKKLGIHIGIHLYVNNMDFSVATMDLGFKPPIFKSIDVDKEIEKVKSILGEYYKDLLVFAKQ